MPRWNVHFELHFDHPDHSLVQLLASIRALSRTIQNIPVPPSVQKRLHNLNIVRAVQGTTGIEGTELTVEEVERVLSSPEYEPALPFTRQREEREVRNAGELMKTVEQILSGSPDQTLTETLVRRFHHIITDGIEYPRNEPGKYRSASVHAGNYLAPAPDEVPGLMIRFFEWLNEGLGRELDPVVQAVVAHFIFISIHPFGDGNGRTARGVESFLLYRARVNVRGFYSLSNFYYRNRSEYVRLLDHVRFISDPDVTPFVAFALRGLLEDLEQVHSEMMEAIRLISFRDYARERIQETGRLGTKTGNRQLWLVYGIAGEEVSWRDLKGGGHTLAGLYRGVGEKTLSRDVKALFDLGLISFEDGVVRANLRTMDEFTGV